MGPPGPTPNGEKGGKEFVKLTTLSNSTESSRMSCIAHSEGSLPYSPTEPFSSLKKTEESTKRKRSAAMDWKKKRKEGDGDERGMGQGALT